MKTVVFKKLVVDNFKAIEHFEVEFGQITRIIGANETGKTSIADAISWCLTGRNSLGELAFSIEPIGRDVNRISVSLSIEIDGRETTLIREKRKTVSKSGKVSKDFKTVCTFDGLECSIKDFEMYIEKYVCRNEIFRLVHDVRYFAENIITSGRERSWEAQRRILFSIFNTKSDRKLAGSKKKYAELSEEMERYEADSIQELIERYIQKGKRLRSELEKVNSEIAGIFNILGSYNRGDAKDRISELTNLIEEKEKEETESLSNVLAEISELNQKIIKLKQHEFRIRREISLEEGMLKAQTVCPSCGQILTNVTDIESRRKSAEKRIPELESALKKVMEQIAQANSELQQRTAQKRRSGLDILKQERAKLLAEIETSENQEKREKECELRRREIATELSENERMLDLCKAFIREKCERFETEVNNSFDGVTFQMFQKVESTGEYKDTCKIYWQGTPYESLSYSTKFIVGLKIVHTFQKVYGLSFPLMVDNAESIDIGERIYDQMIEFVKQDEVCPRCGSSMTGRRGSDGLWTCADCNEEFAKRIKVSIVDQPIT